MKDSVEERIGRHQFEDYFDCERYFMDSHFENIFTVLDISGKDGGFYGALRERYPDLKYSSLDTDKKSLENGKKLYPNAKFIHSDFFTYTPQERFDVVVYFQQLPLSLNWKRVLGKLVSLSDQNIFIECRFRLDGSTISDPDLSFSYYYGLKDSKWNDNAKKVPWIIVNAYEFVSYCLGSFPVSKLELYGYYQDPPPPHFVPMDRKRIIAACCWITLDKIHLIDGRNAIVEWNIPGTSYQ